MDGHVMANRLIHTEKHQTRTGTVHTAKVYRNAEYNEWVVKFAVDSHLLQKSDYFASDKADAVDTAKYHIKRVANQFA